MFAGVPPGLRAFLLNDLALTLARQRKGKPEAYGKESDRIYNQLYQRNARAIDLERAGRIDDAITLYETLVADMFDGPHPYHRLRIIYTRRHQYDQALRACRAFIQTADALIKLGCPRTDLPVKRAKFVEWCTKLTAKIQRQT